jgi:hypothetical protein
MGYILKLIVYIILILINIGGTIAWIYIYAHGTYTEWWVFLMIFSCGLTTILLSKINKT